MRVRILLQISDDDGAAGAAGAIEEVTVFEKAMERPEDIGLSLAESKALLAAIQQRPVAAQAAEWFERQRCCAACGRRRRGKGSYPIVFHTLFGDIPLASPRLCRCRCQNGGGPATMSPLASFIEGCPADWRDLPIPEGRIVVGLDGGYVRDWTEKKTNFEVIVGRSMPEDRPPRYLGLVHGYDRKPKRRLVDVLTSQGLQANQDITFLTDGGEEVLALTELISPCSEHVLDWFQLAMRLTVLGQYAKGIAQVERAAGDQLLADIERIKWLLWHGNIHRAVPAAEDLRDDVETLEVEYPLRGKFVRAAREFAVYIESNTGSLINYGERFRAGERISSRLAESTVNAVISKRFAKRQQMQWTPRGAHLLLQARTRTLDGTLRPLFEQWYPGLANDNIAGPERQAA
jgi:hypothetical protein